ncbi:MAG TPA: HAD-IA family hydrolase [Polyangia bacterium]|jgi:pseudouridine-5'-monophosphatase|nr:HAD-IA family hydrolase [Polyangia bacterium]
MKLSRRPRFAIFDLDGVLLDTEPLYTAATAGVAARFGKVYDWSIKRDCIGRGTLEAARIIVEALGLPLSPEALIDERDRVLVELVARAPAIAGAETFTRALAARGVPLGIATSTEAPLFAIKAARHRDWLGIFGGTVCGDDPRVGRPKPAPDIFLAAARDLGAAPESCLVFEDSPFGVEAACAAGMQVIALPDPAMDRARYARADAVVAGFADLTPDALGF